MSDKTFRDFIARMNQIGQVAHIFISRSITRKDRTEAAPQPAWGECVVVAAYDMVCHGKASTKRRAFSNRCV
jgi:hypothetical protein